MNVSLTPELEKLVADKVASGLYASASEVLRASLRLLAELDRVRSSQAAGLSQEPLSRPTAPERGERFQAETVRERLRRRAEERRRRSA